MALTKVNTDLLEDGGKLDGIEAGADVTDTTNVTAAGALMDSELTSEASVKALNQGVATTDSPTFVDVTATSLDISGNIDVDGTTNLDVVDIDGAVDMASTLAVAGVVTANAGVTVGGNVDFGDLDMARFGVGNDLQIFHNGTDNYIKNATSDQDLIIQGNDGGNIINALTLDMSAAGAATFNAGITASNAGVIKASRSDNARSLLLYTDNTNATVESDTDPLLLISPETITLDAAYDITLDADGGSVFFKDAGTEFFKIRNTGSDVQIYSARPDADMKFEGVDGAVGITALTLDMSAAGAATFNSNVGIGLSPSTWSSSSTALQIGSLALEDYTVSGANVSVFYNNAFRNASDNIVYIESDFASTYSQYNGEHSFSVAPSGTAGATISLTQALKITQSEIVANDGSADRDFRVESDGNAHALFVEGSTGQLRVNTANWPSNTFGDAAGRHIVGGSNEPLFVLWNEASAAANNISTLAIGAKSATATTAFGGGWIRGGLENNSDSDGFLGFYTTKDAGANAEQLRISSSGAATFSSTVTIGGNLLAEDIKAKGSGGLTLQTDDGVKRIIIEDDGDVVINETGVGSDFRVESNGYSHMLFVDAGADIVAFGQTHNISSGGMYFNHSNATKSHLVVSNTETSFSESLYYGNRQNSDGHVFQFRRQNYTVGNISVDSNGTTYNTSSDVRLKENIADADDAGSKIDSIQVRKFDWKADGSHQDYGMVAQELQTVAPEAVSAPENPDEMMGVDYSKLVPMLIKEIQSLRNRVAQLEE